MGRTRIKDVPTYIRTYGRTDVRTDGRADNLATMCSPDFFGKHKIGLFSLVGVIKGFFGCKIHFKLIVN